MRCTSERMTIAATWIDHRRWDLSPSYQRESGVWSLQKKQLFIDSLMHHIDVPKIYVHDLTAREEPINFAVIDGKQRLTTIWDFIRGDFSLADNFVPPVGEGGEGEAPQASEKFTDFSDDWKERFKARSIDVVRVVASDEDEIEELFSRLNNGEPLNAAEKRNAMKGKMVTLIREVAQLPFFRERVSFPNRRYSHYEVAAKFLCLEQNHQQKRELFCDLKKKHLDELVRKNRDITEADSDGLVRRIKKTLGMLAGVFQRDDGRLNKQSYPQLYYLLVKKIDQNYASPTSQSIHSLIDMSLSSYLAARLRNNDKPEDERDASMAEYGRLTQQGTNDSASMELRCELLIRHFLEENPSVVLKDPNRRFTQDERFVIWVSSGKVCAECERNIDNLEDMDADHDDRWADGGPTSLENARCLCVPCNRGR